MLLRRRTFDDNMNDQIIQRPFIMLVSSGDPNGQWCAPLIYQDMDFAALLGSIGGVGSRVTSTQRRRTRATVHRLPLPADVLLTTIKAQHRPKNGLPNTLLAPGLKAFVQYTAGNTKPTGVQGFPLATCPQNEPNAVQYGMVGFTRTTRAGFLCLFGKVLFRNAPHRARHSTIFDVLGFCDMLFHDVSCFVKVWEIPTYNGIRHFLQPFSIFG